MSKTTIFFLFLINLIWSAILYFEPTNTTIFNYLYNIGYGISFLIAGLVSLNLKRIFPQNKLIYMQVFIATGLFFLAQLTWVFYNTVLYSEVPYPSIADIFWILFYIFNIGIAIEIFKALKINFNTSKLIEIFTIFAVLFTISYSFVTQNNNTLSESVAINILNITYPLFDSLLVSMYLSGIRSPEGRFKPALLYFTTSFFIFTLGDNLFSYQTYLETYWNGNFVDVLFAFSGYLYALGVLSLPKILNTSTISNLVNPQKT